METVLWDKVKRLISLKQDLIFLKSLSDELKPIFFEIKAGLGLEV